jgi:Xaa-Pro dipeptidase
MRYSAYVASNAHVEVMRTVSAGMFEYELEAKFLYEIYKTGGCRKAAYTSICGCGPNAATLHYGHAGAPNTRLLQPTDIALLDMGADYHGYVSDITCSFPVSGKFTGDQALVFTAVLSAQRAVAALLRPGVSWVDCHRAAERAILTTLTEGGLLTGDVEEMIEAVLGPVFFPHGLGHLIGCDTHDVGGYISGTPDREARPGLKSLRTARLLEPNMVLTNEPGCYFVNYLLDNALANPNQCKFINQDVLIRFRGFGGVRLEDVIVITENGFENLTTCPRTIEEIEAVLAGGVWPPTVDNAPELKRNWTTLGADGEGMVPVAISQAVGWSV